MKFFLAREGVAFGPYTEFQVRESVRLGIFEPNDLALAENGTEWATVEALLPAQQTLPLQEARESVATGDAAGPHAAPADHFPSDRIPVPKLLASAKKWALAGGLAALILGALLFGRFGLPQRSKVSPVVVVPPARPPQAANAQMQSTEPPPTVVATPLSEPTPDSAALTSAIPGPTAPSQSTSAQLEPDSPVPAVPTLPVADTGPQRKIEGQIYISAKNGINYEPSAVEVRLYPLSLLKPYLEKRGSEANTKYEELKAQIQVAESEKERMRKVADTTFDSYVQAQDAADRRQLEAAVSEAKKAREKAANAYYRLMQDREDILSGAFYVEDLPKSVDVTRTDAQGRFNFLVPVDGEFAVVAGAQRGTENSAERYYWFVPVNIDGEAKKTVLLSNTNVSSHGSADSLVQTVD